MTRHKTTRYLTCFILGCVFMLAVGLRDGFAIPVLGQQLYYQGGAIEITILPYEAFFTNNLFLSSPAGPVPVASNIDIGKVITLHNVGLSGIAIGDELVFGINVLNTRDQFVIGPASRNVDDVA